MCVCIHKLLVHRKLPCANVEHQCMYRFVHSAGVLGASVHICKHSCASVCANLLLALGHEGGPGG